MRRSLALLALLCGGPGFGIGPAPTYLPGCGARAYVSVGRDPYLAMLRPHLEKAPEPWYRHYIELPDADPLFQQMAAKLTQGDLEGQVEPVTDFKGQPYVLMGGSVLIDAIAGTGIRTGGIGFGSIELNILFPASHNEKLYNSFLEPVTVEAPAFGQRPAGTFKVNANGELNNDLITYVGNARPGSYLLGSNWTINAPFKSGALLSVPTNPKEKVRLYFRTKKDFDDYVAKTLRLPDDEHPAAADWHKEAHNPVIASKLGYALIVYARLKARENREKSPPPHWHYSPTTKTILQAWVAKIRLDASTYASVLRDARQRAKDQGATDEMAVVLREFGLLD